MSDAGSAGSEGRTYVMLFYKKNRRSKRERILVWILFMNARKKLGLHAQTQGMVLGRGAKANARGAVPSASQVLARGAETVARGAARCASQVLGRGAEADSRGATRVYDRGVKAIARGAARCALNVSRFCRRRFVGSWFAPAARSAKTDACGRSFAVLSTKVSTVGLRQGWRVAARLKRAVTLSKQKKNNSSVVQRSRVNIALSVQQPLTLAAIYLSRVGVVGCVFAAALTV